MSWRHELRGVRRVDLACAVLLVPVTLWAGSVALAQGAEDAPETRVSVEEIQVKTPGETYAETWEWCKGRFPYREDLQEACQWGAFEMLPGERFPTEEEAHDA